MICPHCGNPHAAGLDTCPTTGWRMNAPGLIGKQLDRYKLERLLGQGGFGSVYRARHVHTDANVALKLLKKELGADQSMIDRFMREAKAAGAVGSEHIVGVLDAGVTDGQAFLALELLEGWDLKDLVVREGAAPERIVAITVQVLDALAAAHAKGIVHRDMKPANVFVVQKAGRDFIKLLDFGISKMHADPGAPSGLTMTGMAMGTPAYMAPEQFFDARSVDGRADLYSVAVMLYELLAKRLPFDAQSYAELIVKVRTEVPPPLASVMPGLPAQLCAVVDKGLAREKEQRWQSAQQMADALRTATAPGWSAGRSHATPMPVRSPIADTPSMLTGKTAAPRPMGAASFGPTPAPVVAVPTAPTPPPSFGGGPLPVAPQPAASSGKSTWIWVLVGLGIVFGGCCILGVLVKLAEGQ